MAEHGYWTSLYPVPLSRRRFLKRTAAGGVGLTAMALVGCGGGTKSGSGSARASREPKRGGILQYGIDNLQDVMDPHQTTRVTYTTVWQNISHHLIGIDPATGGFTDTEASQSYEQPDATTLVFHLWPGITWHETPDIKSRPFTSQDVVYNLQRIATNEPRFPRRSQFDQIDSVTAPDNATVIIKLKRPYAPMLYYLGSGYNVLVNPDAVEKFGVIDRVSAASGIGPFVLKTLDKAAGATLERNKGYFREGLPYLDGINIVGFSDAQTALASLRTGQIHVYNIPLSAEDQIVSSVKDIQLFPSAQPGQYVGPGITFKVPPFNDMRVRQAISLVIDRHAMITEAYQGRRAHLLSPVPWGLGDFAIPEKELATLPGYRKEKDEDFRTARQLLQAAGLRPEDIKVHSTVGNLSYYPPTYETVVPKLRAFGFDIDVKVMDNTAFRNAQSKGDYVWHWNLSLVDAEPDAVLRLFNYTGASRNYNGFSDPEIDRLIDQQAEELDRDARIQLTRTISKRLIERPNWILTANQEILYAVQPFVRGFRVARAGTTDAQDQTRTWLDQ